MSVRLSDYAREQMIAALSEPMPKRVSLHTGDPEPPIKGDYLLYEKLSSLITDRDIMTVENISIDGVVAFKPTEWHIQRHDNADYLVVTAWERITSTSEA